jgi:hypothetical protein
MQRKPIEETVKAVLQDVDASWKAEDPEGHEPHTAWKRGVVEALRWVTTGRTGQTIQASLVRLNRKD